MAYVLSMSPTQLDAAHLASQPSPVVSNTLTNVPISSPGSRSTSTTPVYNDPCNSIGSQVPNTSTASSDGFQLPRKSVKWSSTNAIDSSSKIPLKNSFQALCSLGDQVSPRTNANDTNDNMDEEFEESIPKIHVPPIFVKLNWILLIHVVIVMYVMFQKLCPMVNMSSMIRDLKAQFEDFTYKNLKENMKFECSSSDPYRKLTQYLTDKNLEFYTYQVPSDKKLNVVLRGLPVNIEEAEILSELQSLSYNIQCHEN